MLSIMPPFPCRAALRVDNTFLTFICQIVLIRPAILSPPDDFLPVRLAAPLGCGFFSQHGF
jgi:hypothetical protein